MSAVKTKCLNCDEAVYSRGVCRDCYKAFHNALNTNEVTEAEAIAVGFIRAKGIAGRPLSERRSQLIDKVRAHRAANPT